MAEGCAWYIYGPKILLLMCSTLRFYPGRAHLTGPSNPPSTLAQPSVLPLSPSPHSLIVETSLGLQTRFPNTGQVGEPGTAHAGSKELEFLPMYIYGRLVRQVEEQLGTMNIQLGEDFSRLSLEVGWKR